MCYLVGDQDGDVLAGPLCAGVRPEEQGSLPEGEQPPVLHGADVEVRHRHQVQLGQAVGHREELREVGQRFDGDVQGKLAPTRPALRDTLSTAPTDGRYLRSVDGDRDALAGPLGDGGVVAQHDTDEVAGQGGGGLEHHHLALLPGHRHVGQDREGGVRPRHGDGEGRSDSDSSGSQGVGGKLPELRLVEAGEAFPSSCGLEVTGSTPTLYNV